MINDNGNYVSGGDSTDNRITIYPTQEKMQFELIETITLDADVSQIFRTNEPNGASYYFDSLFVKMTLPSAIDGITVYAIGSKSCYVSKGVTFKYAKIYFQRINGLIVAHAELFNTTQNASDILYPPQASNEDIGVINSLRFVASNIPAGTKIEIYATRRHDL